MDYNEYYCEKCGNYIESDGSLGDRAESSGMALNLESSVKSFLSKIASLVF